MTQADEHLMPSLPSRADYFDYLDGRSVRAGEELVERRLTGPVPKTYLLETVPDGEHGPDPTALFRHDAISVEQVGSDGLFSVFDRRLSGVIGLVEWLNDRHPVLYTLLTATSSDKWVRDVIDSDPWLDRLWLSAPTFERLWHYVESSVPGHRFTTLKFDYDAFYEVYEGDSVPVVDEALEDEASTASAGGEGDADDTTPVERRKSVFSLSDRVATLHSRLDRLQDLYRPLESMVQLRIPAQGRGGHDFYYDGKVTNRSDSFMDHRQHAKYVVDLYRRSTDAVEQNLWLQARDGDSNARGGFAFHGAPLVLRFGDPLTEATFERWVMNVFNRRRNRFRLTGRVARLGPTKAHICAIDRHLWRPVLLEVTSRQIIAILPRGTCGNTVHRLVTNVQRFLDPGVRAWIGGTPYSEIVGLASRGRV